MTVDASFVLSALLQHNFLPMQKKLHEELPPIFKSVSFTPAAAAKLVAGKSRKAIGYSGYDTVAYRLTRFNGVPRECSIPHPAAYAHLSTCIHSNWGKLDYTATNAVSMIRPTTHSDGRVIIMDYENSARRSERILAMSFGRRFLAHTDIANFFPSVYSHAIPWATVGFDHAKKHKPPKFKTEWFNQVDEMVRLNKRGETQGVAIGPATSNIVSESILARIDETLSKEFSYTRFIDDYTAYCSTDDECQLFFRRLSEELAKFKLLLNIRKTEAIPLPHAMATDWVAELALALPAGDEISRYDATNYLNLAVKVARGSPDGSVLKYALKSVLSRTLDFDAADSVLQFALNLSFHQPALVPLLEKLFDLTMPFGVFYYKKQLQRLAYEHAKYRRSDAVSWALYMHNRFGVEIEIPCADEVLVSRDCIPLLLLYLSGNATHQGRVVAFAKGLDPDDLYELDQYWLLLYQLFLDKQIPSPYADEDAFEILASEGVHFVVPPRPAGAAP